MALKLYFYIYLMNCLISDKFKPVLFSIKSIFILFISLYAKYALILSILLSTKSASPLFHLLINSSVDLQ